MPGQEPAIDFALCEGELVEEVYAYCNLHGLWKCLITNSVFLSKG
ncbi:hypothetical protein DW160_01490 [Lachnospira eligens]|nr:hypothetical protein DW160_01490 [Lachnospira eligens]